MSAVVFSICFDLFGLVKIEPYDLLMEANKFEITATVRVALSIQ